MSAFNNIETAAEVPIMDGSSGPFDFLMRSAGLEEKRNENSLHFALPLSVLWKYLLDAIGRI